MNIMVMDPILVKNAAPPLTQTAISDSTAAPSSTPTSSSLPPAPTPSPPPDTLITSSKIGIGVGVALGALIIITSTVLLLRRARGNKLRNQEPYIEKPELDGQPRTKSDYAAEIHEGEIHELPAPNDPVEADVPTTMAEFEAQHGVNEVPVGESTGR